MFVEYLVTFEKPQQHGTLNLTVRKIHSLFSPEIKLDFVVFILTLAHAGNERSKHKPSFQRTTVIKF